MREKLLFIVTEDWYFLSHRLALALACKKNGYEVYVACKNTGKTEKIKEYGFNYIELKLYRGYSSIFIVFKNILEISKVLKKSGASIVHAVSIQSILIVLFSTLFNSKIKLVAAVTGLGSLFLDSNFRDKIIKNIISILLIVLLKKKNLKVIVQNSDDKFFFNTKLFCSSKKIFLIRGSGVNINYHKFQEEPKRLPIIVSYVGRFIKDKGIEELIKAFEIVSKKNKNIKLFLVGKIDDSNLRPISKSFIKNAINKNKNIRFLGEVNDIREIWKKSHIAILASKREGLPKSLLEAASSGRAIISTDVPGSREIAIDSFNAKVVKLGDINALAEAILFLSKNNKIRKKYGFKSRELVESDMSEGKIIESTLSLYKSFN